MPRWCWAARLSIISHLAVTTAGWKVNRSSVPFYFPTKGLLHIVLAESAEAIFKIKRIIKQFKKHVHHKFIGNFWFSRKSVAHPFVLGIDTVWFLYSPCAGMSRDKAEVVEKRKKQRKNRCISGKRLCMTSGWEGQSCPLVDTAAMIWRISSRCTVEVRRLRLP